MVPVLPARSVRPKESARLPVPRLITSLNIELIIKLSCGEITRFAFLIGGSTSASDSVLFLVEWVSSRGVVSVDFSNKLSSSVEWGGFSIVVAGLALNNSSPEAEIILSIK